jgi:hypothetical protein
MELSRRMFLKRSSAAVALAGAASTVPFLSDVGETAAPAATSTAALSETAGATEPVIAHLADLASGQVHLYVGTQHITVNDPHLASLLYRASH